MRSPRLYQLSVLLAVLLSYQWRAVNGSYYPIYGQASSVFYNASTDHSRYPDVTHIVPSAYQYFLSDLTFDVVNGKIVCGAADKLYILDVGDLTEVSLLSWEPETTKTATCETEVTESPDYNCRNHIRVHLPIPSATADGEDPALMVCGTQATISPQCRVVRVGSAGTMLQGFATVDASEGIVSYYPDFSQFGDFREDGGGDMTYFTAGFFQGLSGLGRHFSISFQSISVSNSPTPNSLTTTERFRTINANNNWLRFPVTFVDSMKLDYEMDDGGNLYDYQFYFAFIRENSAAASSDGVIQSRVVRICRNDQGLDPVDSDDLPYFTTYMKARIFCERQLEGGDQFDAGLEFLYNELRSVAFTEGGRYRGDGNYGKKLYGAFTGPIVGPHGTAICVYDAENTAEGMRGSGRSQSMFDIFREDLQTPSGDRTENNFITCNPAGRSASEAQNILINEEKFVSQLESDPLVVMDGLLVNQMVLDEQCVVKVDDQNSCINQDVLFLGTDSGKVVKVMFGTDSSGVFPVVAEELSLDDGNNIEKMVIHDEGDGERNLFVNTNSKIYKFPLARCSRHSTCLECVAARDPYCVWDGDVNQCISNPFSVERNGTATVDSARYKQNVHSGNGGTAECMAESHCSVSVSPLNYHTIQVEATCTNTNQIRISAAGLTVSDALITLGTDGTGSTTVTGAEGLQSYTVQVTALQTGASDGVTITTIVTTPPGPPVAVTTNQILVDSITSASFRVSVNIDKFTNYFADYSFKLQGGVTAQQPFTDGTSHTLTGLTPATNYAFTVAINNTIAVVTTGSISVKTFDDIPSEARNVTGESGMTNVDLSWAAPSRPKGDIIGYVVRVGGVEVRGCGGWGDSVGTSYDVTGLSPSTTYQFMVAACTSAGEGSSVSIPRTTLCASPQQVTDLQIMPTSHTTLKYSWSRPNVVNGPDNTLGYMVSTTCFNESGTVTDSLTFASSQPTNAYLSSLSPLTLCCVRVLPSNSCPEQPTLSGLLVEACAITNDTVPGPVTSLTVTGVNRGAILVTWAPPTNYERSGLDYIVRVSTDGDTTVAEETVVDRGYFYLGGLTADTEFSVRVSARSGEGEGEIVQAEGNTLPDAPPPPGNPQLAVADNDTLTLSWDPVGGVSEYVTVLRCNEQPAVMETVIEGTSVNFDVVNPEPNFAWCTAQIQSKNNIGLGEFSELVSMAIPSSAPSTPRCYLVDDQGSSISVSFDVTSPFSLESLSVGYKLIADFQRADMVEESVVQFDGNNTLILPVSRNTEYDFQLRLCNVHGCSGVCKDLTNFTTSSTAPRPPSEITVTDITHTSATLSWNIPDFENSSAIAYLLQVTSAGAGGGTHTIPGVITSLSLPGLDPETRYAVAIQVRDTATEVEGMFGPTRSFTTATGAPSIPTALEVKWVSARRELSVSWGVPNVTNGTIRSYELTYSGNAKAECGNPGNDVVVRNLTADARSFVTKETAAIVSTDAFLVCVRGHTDRPGEWAVFFEFDISIEAVTGTDGGSNGNCNGLIAVAVVAGLAVVSTVIAAAVLFIVVRHHNNQVADRHSRSSSTEDQLGGGGAGQMTTHDRNSPSRGSNDTGFDENPRLPYNSQQSTDSMSSTKNLLPNGRS